MDSDRYQRVKRLFTAAAGMAAESRRAFLERECGGDAELRGEVEQLFAFDDSSGLLGSVDNVVERMDSPSPTPLVASSGPIEQPTRVGRYMIIRPIGQGGMGIVYEAEQDEPRRVIALKMIRPGVASQRVMRRFRFEAQVLGRLQHEGIAQIYEAGAAEHVAPDGQTIRQPFFAMEYVRGQPLLAHAHASRLGIRDRLALLARICDSVHHAHQKGVIHRDLKPANILVTADGRPKVLDFGVARLVDAADDESTAHTLDGQLVGTMPYMSPEQVSGDTRDLDTRADVYSLGVVGYELLTGELPHDVRNKTIAQAARIICEEPPTSLTSRNPALHADLNAIFAKALERNREERFASAAELAADIRRHLNHEPVLARPADAWYQLRKFAARHRVMVLSSVAVVAALAMGLGVASWQAVRAWRAEQVARGESQARAEALQLADRRRVEAETAADRARLTLNFLTDMLASAQPLHGGDDVTVRSVVDEAAVRIIELTDEPELEAPIRLTLGKTLFAIGEYEPALSHIDRSIELYERLYGPRDRHALDGHGQRARLLIELGDMSAARAAAELAVSRGEEEFGPYAYETLRGRNELAHVLYFAGAHAEAAAMFEVICKYADPDDPWMKIIRRAALSGLILANQSLGRVEEAVRLAEESLIEYADTLGTSHPHYLTVLENISKSYREMGRIEEAERAGREIFAARRQQYGERHPATLRAMANLGEFLNQTGQFGPGEPILREALELHRELLGDRHHGTLTVANNYASVLRKLDREEDAIALWRRTIADTYETLGDSHPMTLGMLSNLANAEMQMGQVAQAEATLRGLLSRMKSLAGESHPTTLVIWSNFANALRELGRFEEACAEYCELLDRCEDALPSEHIYIPLFRSNYGVSLIGAGRYDEAESELLSALADFERRGPNGAMHLDAVYERLAMLEEARSADGDR